MKLFSNFLTSHALHPGDPRREQLIFVTAANVVGMAAAAFFAFHHWERGGLTLAYLELIAFGTVFVNVWLLRRSLNVERASRILLAVLTTLLLGTLLNHGFDRVGLFWFATFPLVAFFFKGRRRGTGWVVTLGAGLLAIILAQTAGWVVTAFSSSELFVVLGALQLTSAMVYVYERSREEQAQRLLELNRRLEREARERQVAENALRQSDARLRHLAHHDQLTQLPNRVLLQDRLQQAMGFADRSGQLVAVIFVDLDNFKPVNDALGHEGGDRLLVQVADRLKSRLRSTDTVARYGGDEFVAVVRLATRHQAHEIAEKIIAELAAPFLIDGEPFQIGASLGLAFYPEDGRDCDTLISNADTAMYTAKQQGKGRWSDQQKKMEGNACLPSIGV